MAHSAFSRHRDNIESTPAMAFKFDNSEEGFDPSLNLFKPPPMNTAIYKKEWVSFRPVSQITKGSPIQFSFAGSSSDYKDLKKMVLYLKVRILKPTGAPITKEDNVGFSNLTLQSLFKQVDLSLQQNNLTSAVGLNYSYKAMLDTLLKYDEEPKETQLQSQLYYKDSPGFMDESSCIDGGNLGLLQRSNLTEDGQYMELEGPIYTDITQQDRLLINGVQFDLKLIPNSDAFALMSPTSEQYSFEIGEAILKVCQAKLNPGVLISHAEQLKKSPALYPYMKSDVRSFNIQPGTFAWGMDDIFQGQIPSRVVVALLSSQAYTGNYNKNPFNFQHYSCNYMGFFTDGQSVPGEPITCDYKSGNYVNAYLSTFTGVGKYGLNEGNYISREDYPNGYCIYVFDVSGRHGREYLDLIKRGHTRLSIRFDQPPQETVTVLVYSSFPAIFQIDESRSVIY